jgi:acyl-CoA reductase-like NAD-dependent aldehyde dehydrogenase
MERVGSFVGGRDASGAGGSASDIRGKVLPVRSPFDGEVVREVTLADAETLDAAAEAAVRAQPAMAALTREARAGILERIAVGLGARREELARTLQRESGKPIAYARLEVDRAGDTFRASAEAARQLAGQEIPLDAATPGAGRVAFTRRFPVGPVASITPFNFPLNLVAHKVGPAIAAGCANVVKPASATPLSALLLAGIAHEAGVPPGGLSVVVCDRAVGQRLVEDDRFRLLSFTGSAEVGWRMKRDAGKKRVTLELGGNAAAIVLADADVDHAAARCAVGGFYQAGQSCISVQRVIVHRDVYDRLRDAIVDRTRAIVWGDPSADTTVCGPLIDAANADRVVAWVDEALGRGARRLAGGQREGAVVAPTLLEAVPRDARVSAEEVFGPVIVLDVVGSVDEALHVAGATRFGLQCGIFTHDVRALLRAWEELEVGAVIHDDAPAFRVDLMPYGGVRDSGLGREGPRWAVEEMTEPRLLVLKR